VAVQAEVSAFIAGHTHLLDKKSRQRLVRHGSLPVRCVMTGIGAVPVVMPRVRDRESNPDGTKIRFRSSLVPLYLRKARSVEEFEPWLCTSRAFRRVISARRCPRLLGPLHKVCHHRPSTV